MEKEWELEIEWNSNSGVTCERRFFIMIFYLGIMVRYELIIT
jgi:hypothetical protein